MAKPKKKLNAAQRAAKKQRRLDFMTVFINGKQVSVRRPPTIDGMDQEEFIRENADDIWLHQHGYYELMHEREMEEQGELAASAKPLTHKPKAIEDDDYLPF